jgi:uncharacterized surface protein with fasciclin (FAS1) repeats
MLDEPSNVKDIPIEIKPKEWIMRQTLISLLITVLAAAHLAAAPEQEQTQSNDQMGGSESGDTIVDIASGDSQFETLVTALQEAGLVETLSGGGPFTVFAPTNSAFEALPNGTLESLLDNPDALADVLLYHVVEGRVPAADVTGMSSAQSVQGQPLVVSTNGGVMINDATVTATDITASNGVIHVIDTVLTPPSGNLVEVATNAGSFDTLVTAVQEAGLVETLSGEGPFTVFAPTDEAFNALPDGTLDSLLNNPQQLAEVLTYHVVSGRVFSGDVVNINEASTVQGSNIAVSLQDGSVMLNESATVQQTDILATNGVIHVIDSVILPPSMQ